MLDLPSPVAFLESEYEQACGQCEPVDRQQYPIAAQEHPAEAQEKGHGSCEEDARVQGVCFDELLTFLVAKAIESFQGLLLPNCGDSGEDRFLI